MARDVQWAWRNTRGPREAYKNLVRFVGSNRRTVTVRWAQSERAIYLQTKGKDAVETRWGWGNGVRGNPYFHIRRPENLSVRDARRTRLTPTGVFVRGHGIRRCPCIARQFRTPKTTVAGTLRRLLARTYYFVWTRKKTVS